MVSMFDLDFSGFLCVAFIHHCGKKNLRIVRVILHTFVFGMFGCFVDVIFICVSAIYLGSTLVI